MWAVCRKAGPDVRFESVLQHLRLGPKKFPRPDRNQGAFGQHHVPQYKNPVKDFGNKAFLQELEYAGSYGGGATTSNTMDFVKTDLQLGSR